MPEQWKSFINNTDGCYLIVATPKDASGFMICDTAPNQNLLFRTGNSVDYITLPFGKYQLRKMLKNAVPHNERILQNIVDKAGDAFKNYTDENDTCPTARDSYKTLLDLLQMPYHSTIVQYRYTGDC